LLLIVLVVTIGVVWLGMAWLGSMPQATGGAPTASAQATSGPSAPNNVVSAAAGPAVSPSAGLTLAVPNLDGKPPIKVGVVVSLLNSTNHEPSGKLFGFEKCSRVAKDLRGADMDIRPIIEAGSESSEAQAASLKVFFPGKKSIDAGDDAAMSELDVIVACEVWVPDPALVQSIHRAVSGGVSMLNGGGMGEASGDSEAVAALAGQTESRWGQSSGPIACEVVADHPVLAGFHVGQTLKLRPLGLYGPLVAGSVPLIKVTDVQNVSISGQFGNAPDTYYPVYISSLGKGKLICYQYAAFGAPSVELRDTNRARFLRRCVRWLAGRAVQ
jgi:hypothetical protein